MKRIREIELKIANKYRNQKMRCPVHLSVGQEIVSSIFQFFCKKKDYAVSTHRCHSHYLAKGGDLLNMILEIYGKKGCSSGKGGSMHLVDKKKNFMGASAIVGNSIPVGIGLAQSLILSENKYNVSFIFFGDGATEEGVFYESLNYASLHNLPVVFICENNLYSVYSNLKVRRAKKFSLKKLVNSFDIKYLESNNYNINSYFRIFEKGLNFSRKNRKPIFLNFFTYRWLEHCGPNYDNDIGYRNIKEFNFWKNKDPLLLLKRKLLQMKKNIKILNRIDNRIEDQITKKFKIAENSVSINQSEAFAGVFKT